jgi:hypothetical protein
MEKKLTNILKVIHVQFVRKFIITHFFGVPYAIQNVLQDDFPNWTSEFQNLDLCIRNTQLNADAHTEYLEWIPFEKFKDIEKEDLELFILLPGLKVQDGNGIMN